MADENRYLRILQKGVEPYNESHNFLYAYRVFRNCLNWRMELICPQDGKRGFIDYKLVFLHSCACIHVEVEKFGAPLKAPISASIWSDVVPTLKTFASVCSPI